MVPRNSAYRHYIGTATVRQKLYSYQVYTTRTQNIRTVETEHVICPTVPIFRVRVVRNMACKHAGMPFFAGGGGIVGFDCYCDAPYQY